MPELSTLVMTEKKFSLAVFNKDESRIKKSITVNTSLNFVGANTATSSKSAYQIIYYYSDVSLRLDVKVSRYLRNLKDILFPNSDV